MTKTIKDKLWNVAKNSLKVLPFGSLINLFNSKSFIKRENEGRDFLKACAHILYIFTSVAYLANAGFTETLNPLEFDSKYKEKTERQNQIRADYDKIFGFYGLADKNHDGDVSDFEKRDAWEEMGLTRYPYPYDTPPGLTPNTLTKYLQNHKK